MSSVVDEAEPQSRAMRRAFRIFATIERVGNKLPHPFWLFWILAALVIVASAILAALNISTISPTDGSEVAVKSLLSADGMALIFGGAVDNFASFPPLAMILTTMLGVAVADHSGLIDTVLRSTVTKVSTKYLTFALCMAGMIGHVAGDAAIVTLVPLGALVFRAVGRSPVLGATVAYVATSAGYDASPSITPTDVLLSSITTAAANTIDETALVTPVSNYFFGAASSVLVSLTITLVVEKVISKRPDLAADEDIEHHIDSVADLSTTPQQQRAMRFAGLAGLAILALVVIALIPPASIFRGEGGGVINSPLITGTAFIFGVTFAVMGWVYGRSVGTFSSSRDFFNAMVEGIKSMAPILVLFFAISQFLAYFKWTGIGEIIAINGAALLENINAPGWAILLGVAMLISVMNFIITSGSAMWSLAAPIFVPMLMLLDIPPETTQALYRIADSVTNCVTPMSAYFVMTLGIVQRYRKSAGIGTLASFTMPMAAVVWVVWMAFFMLWYLLGIPFGI